jgi:hypothetical protein
MSDTKQVAIRLPNAVVAAVEQVAREERRKPAALMRILIEDGVSERKQAVGHAA